MDTKRLIIICEGPTELQFCREVLYPHFSAKSIFIETPLIKKSHGGCVAWEFLEPDINLHLKQNPTAFVTTFIDLYGLFRPKNYPGWSDGLKKSDIYERVSFLEQSMAECLHDDIRYRFIPNIVIHEFEGLLFNEIKYFDELLEQNEYKDKAALEKIFRDFPNPELINERPESAPSKRLKNIILKEYSKVDTGIRIAKTIGLHAIRQKSKHFDEWITKLENL